MLLVKLEYMEGWTEKRRSNARSYQALLEGIPGVKFPQDQDYERPVYHTFIIQAEYRDELKSYLADQGIGTAVHYPVPVHRQSGYREKCRVGPGGLEVTERLSSEIFSLPLYPFLTEEELERVVRALLASSSGSAPTSGR